MVKKGDTLIEVLLAVGIFSMIAISVVAVMSGGTSEAQLALETTLTRQEIDAQAEALRYIHDSYINDKNSKQADGGKNTNLSTIALWKAITDNAIVLNDSNSDADKEIVEYAPGTCANILDSNSTIRQHAFILDTRRLNQDNAVAYIKAKPTDGKESIFFPASTYPRLIFGDDNANLTEQNAQSINSGKTNLVGDIVNLSALNRVEGIYIIAVADKGTTAVLDYDGKPTAANKGPAYYDFYIRTCWYGTDAETPSTISTVIRLHNPDVQTQYYKHIALICDESGNCPNPQSQSPVNSTPLDTIRDKNQVGWTFTGKWCKVKINVGDSCPGDNEVSSIFFNTDPDEKVYTFYPIWTQTKYKIHYDSNGSSWTRDVQICTVNWGTNQSDCYIAADDITRSGYVFEGWCDGQVDTRTGTCSGTKYSKGQNIHVPLPNNATDLYLKAIWREHNETITIKLTWNQVIDYDEHLIGTKSNGELFSTDFINKEPTETVSGVTRVLAKLDHDCMGSCKDETITINTLGGRNYYFYVHNWTNSNNVTGATITVNGPYIGTHTFSSDRNISGTGRYWNVFAYKDGKLVTPGANGSTTRSASPNTSY